MRRISHDLPGIAARIAKLGDSFDLVVQETSETWQDAQGRLFLKQHTSDVRPTLGQLVSGVTRSIELFEEISKRLRDPDQP